MGPALSGWDFCQAGKAHPLHACLKKVDGDAARIELMQDDFAPASGPSDIGGGQWIVMGGGMVVGCKDLITYLKKHRNVHL